MKKAIITGLGMVLLSCSARQACAAPLISNNTSEILGVRVSAAVPKEEDFSRKDFSEEEIKAKIGKIPGRLPRIERDWNRYTRIEKGGSVDVARERLLKNVKLPLLDELEIAQVTEGRGDSRVVHDVIRMRDKSLLISARGAPEEEDLFSISIIVEEAQYDQPGNWIGLTVVQVYDVDDNLIGELDVNVESKRMDYTTNFPYEEGGRKKYSTQINYSPRNISGIELKEQEDGQRIVVITLDVSSQKTKL